MQRVTFLLLLLVSAQAAAEPLVIRGATMGTTYQVKLALVPASLDAARLESEIAAALHDIDMRMSTYRADSEVSRFNRFAAGEWFDVSPATAEVVAAALEISRQTDGALDVTVGPLVRLWHFGPNSAPGSGGTTEVLPPAEEQIAATLRHVGHTMLEVRSDPPALRKQVAGLEIDLSAVGEGYAVDRVAALLTEHGLEHFLISLGGEVRAAGRRGEGSPWRVGIQKPLADGQPLQTAVSLTDASLATSGNYRRYFDHAGRRYPHVIDPSTGQPVQHTLASVSVVADTCLTADAWATALMVLGPLRGYDCARKHGIAALLMSREDDRSIARATPAWSAKFGVDSD